MSDASGNVEPKPDNGDAESVDFATLLADRVRSAAQALPSDTPMAVVFRVDPAKDQE
jgi:hypothetical protein